MNIAWRTLLRPGDWVLLVLAIGGCGALFPWLWHGGIADRAIVKRDGQVVAELDLRSRRELFVDGPLGVTVIVAEPGRVRVHSDPGPRQYCVRQGWLARPGEIAICAPNHVSVQIVGRGSAYDSLNY